MRMAFGSNVSFVGYKEKEEQEAGRRCQSNRLLNSNPVSSDTLNLN
jgi:hypothetical protein